MSKGKRVFVTGSTGCIGTHAVELIMEEGAEVFGFNRSAPLELSGNPFTITSRVTYRISNH